MARKIVLIVEAEQTEGISARKMLIESLRHHVMTAYSGSEALELLERVHADVVLVHSHIEGQSCEDIVSAVAQRFPHVQVVALTPGGSQFCGPVTTIDSMRPQDLVRYFDSAADPQPA